MSARPSTTGPYAPPPMIEVLTPGKVGRARLSYVTVTPEAAADENRYYRRDRFMWIKPGTYARLHTGDTLQMSDTPMERMTNADVLRKAHGDALIFGLGIGMLPVTLLSPQRPLTCAIRSLTVVELDPDVLALVGPQMPADGRLTLVQGDAFAWEPPEGARYDAIYADIWPRIVPENLPEMRRIRERYRPYLNPDNPRAFIDAWCEGIIKRRLR